MKMMNQYTTESELRKEYSLRARRKIFAIGAMCIAWLNLDGTVTVVSNSLSDDPSYLLAVSGETDTEHWNDIVAIAVGERHVVGLKENGDVIATRFKTEYYKYSVRQSKYYAGQCVMWGIGNILFEVLSLKSSRQTHQKEIE